MWENHKKATEILQRNNNCTSKMSINSSKVCINIWQILQVANVIPFWITTKNKYL